MLALKCAIDEALGRRRAARPLIAAQARPSTELWR